jgi:hypothetical protein
MSPHLITQELNNLVRDCRLSKTRLELLASRLQGWNVLEKGAKVISLWRQRRDFEVFLIFLSSETIVYCNDADGLFGAFGPVHNPDDWWLFIDSLKITLATFILLFH